jgi:hypothetical protein
MNITSATLNQQKEISLEMIKESQERQAKLQAMLEQSAQEQKIQQQKQEQHNFSTTA